MVAAAAVEIAMVVTAIGNAQIPNVEIQTLHGGISVIDVMNQNQKVPLEEAVVIEGTTETVMAVETGEAAEVSEVVIEEVEVLADAEVVTEEEDLAEDVDGKSFISSVIDLNKSYNG